MKNNIALENFYGKLYCPVAVVDENGSIVYINKSYADFWGIEMYELAAYNIFKDVEIQKKDIGYAIKDVLTGKHSKIIENYSDSMLKQKHHALPFISTHIFKINIDDIPFAVLVYKNETEIKLLETEIKKASESENEAERLRSTFLSVLSHEMRTPLNIIMGYTSILKETLANKLSEEEAGYFDNLFSGSERLLKSITQILEFAQIEADEYHITTIPVNLNELIEKNIQDTLQSIDPKKITIKKNLPANTIFVSADEQNLNSVLNNLLSNAAKFTNQGFIEIELVLLKDKELAMCKIKDTGIGISAEYIDHIFLPFSQEDLKIGRNYEGNGLGLALAKRYIEKMEGSLLVDSIKGVGSTFTFTLPLAKEHNRSQLKKEKGKKKKMLIIDEFSESFNLLEAFLKTDYELSFSEMNSIDFNELEKSDYDTVIFDINPTTWTECMEFGSRLRKTLPEQIPILVISSEFSSAKIKACRNSCADKFLVKPFSKNSILTILDDIQTEI